MGIAFQFDPICCCPIRISDYYSLDVVVNFRGRFQQSRYAYGSPDNHDSWKYNDCSSRNRSRGHSRERSPYRQWQEPEAGYRSRQWNDESNFDKGPDRSSSYRDHDGWRQPSQQRRAPSPPSNRKVIAVDATTASTTEEEKKALSGSTKDPTNALAVELQQARIELEMHKVALKESQQIQALDEQARATAMQYTAHQELTKALQTRIQEQIDSNAAMGQTFRAQNLLRKNQADERLNKLSKSSTLHEDFQMDRHRVTVLEEASRTTTNKLEIVFARLEQRGNAFQSLFETQQKTTHELTEVSRRLAGVEREADDYRRVMEIIVSLENVQEDLKALRKDVKELLGVTPTADVPSAQQVAETILELSEEPAAHVSTSQVSHHPMPADPITPRRIISEPVGLTTAIENPLLEGSPPDHPMGGVSPSS